VHGCRRPTIHLVFAAFVAALFQPATSAAQLASVESPNLVLVYLEPTQSFLTPHLARSFENSLAFQSRLFDFRPSERITVLLTDFADFGNAGADSVPRNLVTVKIAPLSFAYETFTANERMNYLMNHELVHVATTDRAAGSDRVFRSLFRGKVAPSADHPETIGYFYLTSPRRAAPRWYLEGIAVFLDTWMAGGIGRAQGPYDEMVFRSMVRDSSPFYDPLGLASELTKADFRLEANSYLYGTRFMEYLAYTYSPEAVIRWVARTDGSRAYYASQFRQVFGVSLERAWSDWIAFEREFQAKNLEAIRKYPTTAYKDLSRQALGSVSRAYLDRRRQTVYAGLNYPGALGYVGAISLKNGSIEKLHDIKDPRSYTVTSLAYDEAADTLFYTSDNTAWRDLIALDVKTKQQRILLKDARIGELAFDKADRSLWGVRTFNGICTLVRVPYPYHEWQSVYSWPYGNTAYDLDVSPDGTRVSVSIGEIDGKQVLRVMNVAQMLKNDPTPVAQFDFGTAIPENFVFSEDGRYLYGSSYYSGVSNVFRYELATGKLDALSNAETGFFRPIEVGDGTLLVFRYTGAGFVPAIIDAKPIDDVSPIEFLGAQLVDRRPVLKSWNAGSPLSASIESLSTTPRPYRPLARLGLESIYPIVAGYKDSVAYGVNAVFSDPIQLNSATITASYSPDASLPESERLHLRADYRRYDWTASARLNDADFYDLFGPTQVSRKGYSFGLGHTNVLVFDEPRHLELNIEGRAAGNLDQLPFAQTVAINVNQLYTAIATLKYTDAHASLASVDDEAGQRWSVTARADSPDRSPVTKVYATYDRGFPLALGHSSIWVRSAAGLSPQSSDDPFANFYFGAFGNNYVDHRDEKRYREYYAFPGIPIDAISGRNFGKSMVEWNLPPVRFKRAGTPGFYVSWMRPAVFAGGLVTNMDLPGVRRTAGDLGGQLDFRLTVLSNLDMTLSAGAAAAVDGDGRSHGELMFSLKVLR
jgi:hypothetical protein